MVIRERRLPVVAVMLLNCDAALLVNRSLRVSRLRHCDLEDTVLVVSLDIFLLQIVADVEASLKAAGVSLLTNQLAGLILFIRKL